MGHTQLKTGKDTAKQWLSVEPHVVDGHFFARSSNAAAAAAMPGFAYFRVFSRLRRKLSEGKLFCASLLNDASKAFLEKALRT